MGIALAVGACTASSASAALETFMNYQGLSAGNAKASVSAHSGVVEIEVITDHTACPAVAQGYTGYTSTPFSGGNFTAYLNCGYPRAVWYPSGTSGIYFHGAVHNNNGSTYDYISYGTYWW